jgi:hypothetical protein
VTPAVAGRAKLGSAIPNPRGEGMKKFLFAAMVALMCLTAAMYAALAVIGMHFYPNIPPEIQRQLYRLGYGIIAAGGAAIILFFYFLVNALAFDRK